MIPIVGHAGEGTTTETVKRWEVARGWGKTRGDQGQHRGFSGLWGRSACHCPGRHVSYICLNPQTVQQQEWALMEIVDSWWWWWWWFVRVHQSWHTARLLGMLIVVGLVCGNREYVAFSLYFPPSFAVNLQWLKKCILTWLKNGQRITGHMKRCSASLIIREMHSKTTVRSHLAPVPVAIIRQEVTRFWGCREKGALVCCWWEHRLVRPLWRTVWSILTNSTCSQHTTQRCTPGCYPKKWNTNSKRHMHSHIHCKTIYNSETWKQPKCPSAERMSCIYILKYYSSVTKNEILKSAITCKSDRKRKMLYDFTCMLNLKIKTNEQT